MIWTRGLFGVLALSLVAGTSHVPPVKQVTLTIKSPTLVVGATTATTIVARRANGDTASTKNATWGISKPDVATITMTSGVIKAIAPGTATITTIVSGVTGAAVITVSAPPPPPPPPPPAVANVSVSLPTTWLALGQTTQAAAIARDSSGDVLAGRAVTWTTIPPTVAAVTTGGLVSALTQGSVIVRAIVGAKSGDAPLVVTLPPPPLDTTHLPPIGAQCDTTIDPKYLSDPAIHAALDSAKTQRSRPDCFASVRRVGRKPARTRTP